MTDKERLDDAKRQLLCGFMIDRTDAEWLCDLARTALNAKPPAGSVKVRTAVATNGKRDGIFMCECGDDASEALRAMVRDCEECKRVATNAAIIEAWIPPVVVPVVEGRVQG